MNKTELIPVWLELALVELLLAILVVVASFII